jgi:hypothetical protein
VTRDELPPELLASLVIARKRWHDARLFVEVTPALVDTYRATRCWFQAGKAIKLQPVTAWMGANDLGNMLEAGTFEKKGSQS